MAEKEPLAFIQRITEAARRFAEQESKKKKPASVSEKNVLQELIERARARFTKDKDATKTEAEEWVKKARSGKPEEFIEAQKQAQKDRYRIRFDASDGNLRESVAMEVVRNQAPDWLKAEAAAIEHSPIAAEFIARITILPKELQEDPYVLNREAARLYWSTDWDGITNEARKEVRSILDRTFEKISARVQEIAVADPDGEVVQQFGIVNERSLMQGIDRRVDIYRTRRMEPLPASELAGEPPKDKDGKVNKRSDDFIPWLKKRSKEVQRHQLERTLLNFQRQIDSPVAANLETQRELMDDLLKNLRGGLQRDIPVEDIDFDVKYPVQQYNAEAQKYIDLATKQRDVTKEMKVTETKAERAVVEQETQRQRMVEHRASRQSEFSSLYFSPEERDKWKVNPGIYFNEKLNNIEREAETGDINGKMFEANMGRLKLAGEMLGSDEYVETIRKELPDDSVTQDLIDSINHIDKMDKTARRELSQSIAARIEGIYLNYALSNSSDLKKFGESMERFGDKGILVLGSGEGGLVGDWSTQYEQILKGIVGNDTRLYTKHEAMATRIAVEQLLAEKDSAAYYKEFYNRYQIPGIKLPEEYTEMTKDMAESIVRRAKTVNRLRMRKPVLMEQGLAPGANEWEIGQSSYATLGIEEQMLGAARIRDWFMRKWGNRAEFLLVWNTGALFTAKADKRLWNYVQEQTKQLWEAAHLDDTANNAPARDKALGQLATLLHFNEPQESVQDIISPVKNLTTWKAPVLERMHDMKLKDFERLVAVEEGGFRMQRMLRPYFFMDSLWREHEYSDAIKKAFTHGDKMFLGARLRARGEKFFFNPITLDRDEAEAGLIAEMTDIAKYRPQGIADFLRHSNDVGLQGWYDANRASFGATDIDIHSAFGELNRRFIMINQRIIRDNAEPINYTAIDPLLALAGMSPDERMAALDELDARTKTWWGYVEKVFAVEYPSVGIKTSEQYLSAMKSLHTHLAENGHAQIRKLTGVQYDRYFLHMAWEDDMPAHLLEDIRNIHNISQAYLDDAILDADGKPMPISHRLTSLGTGPGAPAKRAWTDFNLAIETMNAFTEFNFAADEKKFLELCYLMNKNIGVYQGPFLAGEAVLEFTASWLGSAQVKAEYGDFLTGLFDSSVFKDARGSNAPSLSLDKVHEMFEEVEKAAGTFEKRTPRLSHEIERFLRISTVHMMGKEVTVPYLFPDGISWHALFKLAEHNPILKNVVESRFLKNLDKSSPLGLSTYKLLLGAGLITAIVVATTGAELKNEGKDKHSGG